MAEAVNAPVDNLRGALLLVLAALAFTLEVMLMRLVSVEASQPQIVFFRALAQLVVAVVWIGAEHSPAILRTRRPGLQILRGLTSLVVWVLYYASFRFLSMALATTLTFTSSLFAVLLAASLLGERVGKARIGATSLGFFGVVVATGVGTVGFEPATGLGLAAALMMALLVILNRVLARSEPTVTIMFYIGVVTVLGSAPVAWWFWQPLSLPGLLLALCTGCLGVLGMWFTLEAYRVGEVSALAPFPYLRLVFALLVGIWVFQEPLVTRTLVGAGIIVASVVLSGHWERRRAALARAG